MGKKLSKQEKIEHINKCEFHRGTKEGECPWVSKEEAIRLIREKSI